MTRLVLICYTLALWGVCNGYGVPRFDESPNDEYVDESTTLTYTDESTTLTYTDEYTDVSYSEPPVFRKTSFRCLSDGLFAYPPDCTRFVQCSNGRAFVMKCPEGLHFSKYINRCDYPCEARCSPEINKYCGWNKGKEVCNLPRNKGKCQLYIVRYYYDSSEGKCKKFIFGGCDGNENNFVSEKQCMQVCGEMVIQDTTTQDTTDGYPTEDSDWGYSRLHSQDSTDDSWTSDDWSTGSYPATEITEDYQPYSTGPQEESDEDSWITSTDSEPQTTEDFPGGDQTTSRLPDEDSEWFSTEISSSATYSFKARLVDDFHCGGEAAYRNPDDCASFIWCPLDRAVFIPCPPNTHYSEDRGECVDPCLAHCNTSLACQCGWPECHQYNLIDCESDPDAGPCDAREIRYYYDRESGRCKSFYYGGCHGNRNNFRTLRECQRECQISLLAGFRCPSYNGDFGHYPDCVSYYQCKRGIPTLKRCPKGTAFHHLKVKCVPELEAVCVYECHEPDAVYPAPKDCRSYIECVHGVPRLEKCPRGLVFNPNKRSCVLERTSSCVW